MFNNDNKKYINWGPPVFIYNLLGDDFEKIRQIPPDEKYTQGKQGIFSGVEIIESRVGFDDKNKSKINSLLDKYFQDYIKSILLKPVSYLIDGLWVNIYKPNEYIAPHVHLDCDISFIIYLKSNQDLIDKNPYDHPRAGYTVFKWGEKPDSRSVIPIHTESNHEPKDGELVIFPNNLSHYSIPFKTPNINRITVSGNLKLKI
jgi:hypothetical protein